MKLFAPANLAGMLEYKPEKVPTPTDPLDYWYVCPYALDGIGGLVAILPALRFSAILWGAPYYAFAGPQLVQTIRRVLRDPYYEIPLAAIDQYLPEGTDFELCAAEDRGMANRMRAIAARIQKAAHPWYDAAGPIDPVNVQRTMNSEPATLADGSTGYCWQAVKELLEQRYGKAVPAMELEFSLDLQKDVVRRTLIISAETSFQILHQCLMAVFRWHQDTPHQFILPAVRERKSTLYFIGDYPEQMFCPETEPYKWDDADRLSDYLQAGDCFQYTCSPSRSDSPWEMDVRVSRVLPPSEQLLPVCISAAGRVPPESTGGAAGYLEFCRVLANPQDPQYETMRKLERYWPPEETAEEITNRMR